MLALNGSTVPSLYSSAILVVDDSEINQVFLVEALKKCGFTHLMAVASGEAALEHLIAFNPDMIIMDILMPGMDGFECCSRIRKQALFQNVPILIQTIITEPQLRVKAFASGATDFISKPVYPDELHARVRVHLEKGQGFTRLQHYKMRVEKELENARKLQDATLPLQSEINHINHHCQLDIASHFQPSSEIGGDFWGVKSLSPSQTALWMVDFSGHGIAAALNAFRFQAYLNERTSSESDPGQYLSFLCAKLLPLLLEGQFATMFYGIIDTSDNRLTYSTACQPSPIILRGNGTSEILNGSGMLLGVKLQDYETQAIDFFPGDALLLYSDAFTETQKLSGGYIEEEEIIRLLETQASYEAKSIIQHMVHYFSKNCISLLDDLTLCICKRNDPSVKPANKS